MATGAKKAVSGVKPSKKSATSPARRKSPAKAAPKAAPKATPSATPNATPKAAAKGGKKPRRSEKDAAIATELAPAVAIALLGETDRAKGEPAAALEPLGAGAVASEADGKLRVQLLFENGAVLPIEMTDATAQALGKGITKELQKG
jgi:hypothetical protein